MVRWNITKQSESPIFDVTFKYLTMGYILYVPNAEICFNLFFMFSGNILNIDILVSSESLNKNSRGTCTDIRHRHY